jgi:glycosyltransferase 2 family protein
MKKSFKNLLKSVLALILLALLVHSSLLNFGLLVSLFNNPSEVLLVFVLMGLVLLLSSWRWYRLNSTQNFNISYRDTVFSTYIGLTFNNVLPGGVSGDIVRVNYLFKRVPHKKIAGALSILTDRVIGLLGVIFTTCIIGVAYHHLFTHSLFLSWFLSVSSYVGLAFICLFLLFVLTPDTLGITERLQKVFTNKKFIELMLVLKIFKKSPRVLLECTVVSIFIQVLIVYTIVVISQILQFTPVSSLHYAIASMVTQFVNLIPIAPGGIGVGEVAFAKTITMLNPTIPAAYATIFLAYRILNIIFCSLGIVVYLKNGILKRETFVLTNK